MEWLTDIPHFISLCFITLHRYFVSYKLKVCGDLLLIKSIGTIFPNNICLLCVSMLHFGNSHKSQTFQLLLSVMVSCDQGCWCYPCIFGGECHKPHLHKMVNLVSKCYVHSDCSSDQLFHCLSPTLRSSFSLRHNIIEIRSLEDPHDYL